MYLVHGYSCINMAAFSTNHRFFFYKENTTYAAKILKLLTHTILWVMYLALVMEIHSCIANSKNLHSFHIHRKITQLTSSQSSHYTHVLHVPGVVHIPRKTSCCYHHFAVPLTVHPISRFPSPSECSANTTCGPLRMHYNHHSDSKEHKIQIQM